MIFKREQQTEVSPEMNREMREVTHITGGGELRLAAH